MTKRKSQHDPEKSFETASWIMKVKVIVSPLHLFSPHLAWKSKQSITPLLIRSTWKPPLVIGFI